MRSGRYLRANVILESSDGVGLQRGGDVHRWAFIGGLVEDGEDPEETAIRDNGEELTIRLDP